MAFVVTCPHCSARLKTPGLVAAGTLVECPKCSKNFTLKADSPELLDNASPTSKPRKKTKADEDLFDDVEFVEDDEPVKPKRKKRRDEEEEDEEDERPRSKKKRVTDDEVDEEESRPKRGKRRDDDEDELPTTRTKSRKKKKNSLVLILAISVPLLFLLCGGAGYGIYSVFFGGGASSDMLVWAPSGADHVSGANYSKISGYPGLKKNMQPKLARFETFGVRLDDIDELLVARGANAESYVLRTKTAIDVDALMKTAKATEQNAGGKKYFKATMGCYHIPSSKMLVFCPFENQMTDLLKKDPKITISAELRALIDKTSGDLWEVKMSQNAWMMPGPGGAGPKSEYGGARIIGNQVRLVQNLVFPDETSAKSAETLMKNFAQLMKAGTVPGKKLESFDITLNGTTLTLTAIAPLSDDVSLLPGGF